ncbi:MAG: hypothetical protein CFE21_18895 [Bacteroidetes bacterium B1(2017)]|nr:MAG: hypothetical protein CFE21_18895 [Bacteroidetes bacterium B1(2017)]
MNWEQIETIVSLLNNSAGFVAIIVSAFTWLITKQKSDTLQKAEALCLQKEAIKKNLDFLKF